LESVVTYKKIVQVAVAVSAIGFSIFNEADAATIVVNCQASTSRSRITVSGAGLSGFYVARVNSGAGATKSSKVSNYKPTSIGDTVAFVFDSDPAEIAQGASAITANFIKSNRIFRTESVTGMLSEANSNETAGAASAVCTPF
jgi:hypothetical protein